MLEVEVERGAAIRGVVSTASQQRGASPRVSLGSAGHQAARPGGALSPGLILWHFCAALLAFAQLMVVLDSIYD